MKYAITLVGGIGNILQTVPLMAWLKANGHEVVAVKDKDAYCREICEMVSPSYHRLSEVVPQGFECRGNMLSSQRGKQLVMKMSEWAAWFVFHGFDVPDVVNIPLNFSPKISPSSVVLAPCCKPNWPMKRWAYWQGLADKLPGCTVVGLPEDGRLSGDFVDLRGTTSLTELAGILADADYVIAEEGGIAHLSCSVGTRTYIIYGGTDPVKNAPPANAVQIMSSEQFKCQPCQFTGCYSEGSGQSRVYYGCHKEEMVNDYVRCLAALDVHEVMKAISDNGDNCLYGDFRRV